MQIQTILFLILAAIVALGIVGFQYFYKNKKRGKLYVILSFLRFIALFSLFLLLINPKFVKKDYVIEKSNLVVLADNSSSVEAYNASIKLTLDKIRANKALNDRFEVSFYKFGKDFNSLDSLDYRESNTDITNALKSVSSIYSRTNTVSVLISDGNQTLGQDYEFYSNKQKFPIYTMVVGDTTRYEDLRISQVNSNKYAFLKNKFPIELYVNYEGTRSVTTPITISVNGKTVFREQIQLSKSKKTKKISTFIDAGSVGVQTIQIACGSLKNEKNTNNNQKSIAVEVIDEKTKVGIVSSIIHPDIGALKKAIESNEQRSVSIIKPNASPNELDGYTVFICYQPDSSFKNILAYISKKGVSNFLFVGPKTDLDFLNRSQSRYQIETGFPIQEVFGVSNLSFSKYDISDFNLVDYPPLLSNAGHISFSGTNEALLSMNIKGIDIKNSLLSISEFENSKSAVFLGEGIWKWRLQAYRNTQNFESFDQFIGKLIFFLADSKPKNRLNVEYQSIYESVGTATITATYFNEGFVFDDNASLILKLNDAKEIPMLFKGNYFEADLSGLAAGTYDFKVSVVGEKLSQSGKFSILDFDVEQQLLSADYKKLEKLALATNGELLFPNQIDALLTSLNSNNRFLPTQKSNENVVSLISFKLLFAFIIGAFTLEWFIRKYNGLI